MVKFLCPAKVNLFLNLTGKRVDGYHELQSLFAFLDLADELEVKKSENFQIKISGQFASKVDEKNNLLTKILDFFSEEFAIDKNLHIKLKKNIPVGAGLGGGSSDAAFFMIALNKIFSLKLSTSELQKISLKFGSDIAFFFEKSAAIVEGRGEIILPFPNFSEISALLINPKISLSTKAVFQKFSDNFSEKISASSLIKKDVFHLIETLGNDLTKPAISTVKEIEQILSQLKKDGAKIAKMSGSGASCFAIFDNAEQQKNSAKNFPNFFVKEVKILSHA